LGATGESFTFLALSRSVIKSLKVLLHSWVFRRSVDIVPSKEEISMTDGSWFFAGVAPTGDLEEDGSAAGVATEAVAVTTTTGLIPWSVVEMGVTFGIGPEGGTSLLAAPLAGAVFEVASGEGASTLLLLSVAEGLEAPRAVVRRVADNLKE
jgi:hypothetical protein